MNDLDRSAPADRPPRDRASRLSAAILRISRSLDVATVLREAIEGTRALTGASSGAIAMVCERGTDPELHHLRGLAGGAPGDHGVAGRASALRAPAGPAGAASGGGPVRATWSRSASPRPRGRRGRCRERPCTTGASISATSSWATRRAGRRSPQRTRRSWCSSRRRRRRRSRTPGRTATWNGRGPTSRRSSRPRRSESSSLTRRPAARCRSTARGAASSRRSGPPACRRSNSSR